MRETNQSELQSAIYGLLRLVAGYQEWKLVEDLDQDQWTQTLLQNTTKELSEVNADPLNADPKRQNQLIRKLRAYQQVALLENFCFKEVEWD
jgi:hypothetical protein